MQESKDPEVERIVTVLKQVFPPGTLDTMPLPAWVARPKNPYLRLAIAMHRLGIRKPNPVPIA